MRLCEPIGEGLFENPPNNSKVEIPWFSISSRLETLSTDTLKMNVEFWTTFRIRRRKKSTLVSLTWAKVDEVYQFLAKLALVQGNQLLALLCSPFLWFVVSFLFLFQITSWSPHICKNFSRIFQNYTSVPRIPLIMATTNLWNIPCFGVIESGITSSWLLVWQSFTS